MQTVTEDYLNGIADGRNTYAREGMENALEHLANLKATIRGFSAGSPVGQYLRGERDFWIHKLKR